MPPVLAALPEIFAGVSAASAAGELGLGIANATAGAPTAPVTTIPGSPLDIVTGSGQTTGPTSLPANGVLGQAIGSGITGAPAAPAAASGTGGGGGGKSTSTPGIIGGASAPDFNTLPWFQNTGATSPQPGTPQAS